MKENEQKAFDFASNTTKQLITLSTAIITLTITFSKDIVGKIEGSGINCLFWAWGLFILSVFFGVWTLLALTGSLLPMKKKKEKNDDNQEKNDSECCEETFTINGFNVRFPSVLQVLTFLIALVLTGVFGFKSINNSEVPVRKNIDCKDCINVIKTSEYRIENPVKIDTLRVEE